MNATERAMNAVRQLWHLAGARKALAAGTETRPSHPPVAPVETARVRRVEGLGLQRMRGSR